MNDCGQPQYQTLERDTNGNEIHITYQEGYTAIGRPGWATHITTKYNGISYHYGYKRNNDCFFFYVDERRNMPIEAQSALKHWLDTVPYATPALWAGGLNMGKGIKKTKNKIKKTKNKIKKTKKTKNKIKKTKNKRKKPKKTRRI